jgi:DNA-binding NarL/FixJ family response regulator
VTRTTPAERTALEAVFAHGRVKIAAHALGKSPRTIEQQLDSVRRRLDVTTTMEAIRIVLVEEPHT